MKHWTPSSVEEYVFPATMKKVLKLKCKLCCIEGKSNVMKAKEDTNDSDLSEDSDVFDNKHLLATHLIEAHSIHELLSAGYDCWNFLVLVESERRVVLETLISDWLLKKGYF
jgi:hypothetical protein